MAKGASKETMVVGTIPEASHPERIVNADEVLGKILVDRSGKKLGKINRTDHDRESGVVDFLTVGRGGFLHYGAEWFDVPVTRITSIDAKTVKID